jgi:hypothetical protein
LVGRPIYNNIICHHFPRKTTHGILPIFCCSSFCIIKIEFDENLELNYSLDKPLSFGDSLPHTTFKNKRIGVVVVVEYKQQ